MSTLEVTFINVGYGDCILAALERPGAEPFTMLIDGGSGDPGEFVGDTGRLSGANYLRRAGIGKVDLLVATHIHEDHVCGLEQIVEECEIRRFWHCYAVPPGARDRFDASNTASKRKFRAALRSYATIWRRLEGRGCRMEPLFGVQEAVPLAEGLAVDVLGPHEAVRARMCAALDAIYGGAATSADFEALDGWLNQASMILRLRYAGRTILLPADNYQGMDALRARPNLLRADIYKTAHHGQPDSMDEGLAGIIRPSWVVTCASSDRRYGSSYQHTHRAIRRATEEGASCLFSDAVPLPEWTPYIGPRSGVRISISSGGEIATTHLQAAL